MGVSLVGDLILHLKKEDGPGCVGEVVGFCPGDQWVRVKTADGQHRIWLKANAHNVDFDCKEGNHAERADA